MALPQGINFRATLGYVTDSADESFELGTNGGGATYPRTTSQGNVVGWEVSVQQADRDSTQDRRLAGINYDVFAGSAFRIDLPATGSYDINFAAGDKGFSNPTEWSLRDTTTLLATLTSGTPPDGSYKDANNTQWTAAAWPGSNTKLTKTFTTTILRIRNEVSSGNSVIAHLHVAATANPPLGFGKISSNRKYFLPSEAALVLAALESKRKLSRRRFFQWLPGAFWRK